jgi:hypothetical protein
MERVEWGQTKLKLMLLLTTDKLSKLYWSGEVVEFNATILPSIDEIIKHFLLPRLEDKKEHPLTFKSEAEDEISVMIFYLEKGSEGMTLHGWVTDYVHNFRGLAVKKGTD